MCWSVPLCNLTLVCVVESYFGSEDRSMFELREETIPCTSSELSICDGSLEYRDSSLSLMINSD